MLRLRNKMSLRLELAFLRWRTFSRLGGLQFQQDGLQLFFLNNSHESHISRHSFFTPMQYRPPEQRGPSPRLRFVRATIPS